MHRFVPLDVPRWVARFLDHWRPDAAAFVESEIWPNMLAGCSAAAHSADAGQWPAIGAQLRRAGAALPRFRAPLLGAFDPVRAQSDGGRGAAARRSARVRSVAPAT